ncbi:hypothetical protein JCM11641_004261 [Rhodosporidiobolus odoratus]
MSDSKQSRIRLGKQPTARSSASAAERDLTAHLATTSLSSTRLAPPVPPAFPRPATHDSAVASASPPHVNEEDVELLAARLDTSSRVPPRSTSLKLSPPIQTDNLARNPPGSARRPSLEGSAKSVGSGHRINPGAIHYFPLVQVPKKRQDSSTSPSPSAHSAIPPSPNGSTSSVRTAVSPLPSRPSQTHSMAFTPRTAVFPTITPNRSAGNALNAPVFPTARQGTHAAIPSDSLSVRSTSTTSFREHAFPSPNVSSPPPQSPSSYAPSIPPSFRSSRTDGSRGGYAPSLASSTSYAASTTSSTDGPVSIFLDMDAQKRPLTDLLPKKKFSSFFSRGKSKNSANASQLGAVRAGPGGMTYRGKSTSVLDAALATSQTWANKRGEQHRAFAPSEGALGPPAGYRPAHQRQRQAEAAQAGDLGRMTSRSESVMTVDSQAGSVGGFRGGGSGASTFPTRTQTFATRPRPRPGEEEMPAVVTSKAPASTGLGIS